jgi:uncharacterized membrane protein
MTMNNNGDTPVTTLSEVTDRLSAQKAWEAQEAKQANRGSNHKVVGGLIAVVLGFVLFYIASNTGVGTEALRFWMGCAGGAMAIAGSVPIFFGLAQRR